MATQTALMILQTSTTASEIHIDQGALAPLQREANRMVFFSPKWGGKIKERCTRSHLI